MIMLTKDVIDLLKCFDLIQELLPEPRSGQERSFPTTGDRYRVITHYDPENEDLWNAIEKFKKAIGK